MLKKGKKVPLNVTDINGGTGISEVLHCNEAEMEGQGQRSCLEPVLGSLIRRLVFGDAEGQLEQVPVGEGHEERGLDRVGRA